MTNIFAPHFQNEDKAREHLEAIRWPSGAECPAVCPMCASVCRAPRIVSHGVVYESRVVSPGSVGLVLS